MSIKCKCGEKEWEAVQIVGLVTEGRQYTRVPSRVAYRCFGCGAVLGEEKKEKAKKAEKK